MIMPQSDNIRNGYAIYSVRGFNIVVSRSMP